MRARAWAATALLLASCTREQPPTGPQRVLELAAEGAPAQVTEVQAGRDKRRALVASARYRLYLPQRAMLVLSLAAPSRGNDSPRGFLRLRVRADGRGC